ncbi:MAG TPA: bifunctional precorrin-2 dehydrogenase/sirohydrochlorin ferrochelatase [Elusimicrobiota bacterium]|nr:bifunctional precorrin-2 dehydrogenase/sirohydrochlorin ferrochelatase [Elusimicrobiota bacterium]
MKYYPVYLDLRDRSVLIVGGGRIAAQKIRGLTDTRCRIHVVAPDVRPAIAMLARRKRIHWSRRTYRTSDLNGARLVIAATDDPALQKRIADEARARRVWINVVDVPPLCDFIAPAVIRRGAVQIAISTGGSAPALAKFLRRKLERAVGPEYGELARWIGSVRPAILRLPRPRRQSLWNCIVSEPFVRDVKRRGAGQAGATVKRWIRERLPGKSSRRR